jgi:hypothetical protein
MSASKIECNADLGHPCDADDGEPCPECRGEVAYWLGQFNATPASVRRLDTMTKPELDAELIDAGRGHLVRH